MMVVFFGGGYWIKSVRILTEAIPTESAFGFVSVLSGFCCLGVHEAVKRPTVTRPAICLRIGFMGYV